MSQIEPYLNQIQVPENHLHPANVYEMFAVHIALCEALGESCQLPRNLAQPSSASNLPVCKCIFKPLT